MVNELTLLYNTLMTVETKGESTKIMAQCLNYAKQLIDVAKQDAENKAQAQKESEEGAK